MVKLGGEKSQLVRNEILKAARELKNSTKFQNVFISPDLSPYQRKRLNELKLIRNDLNKKLNVLPSPVSYYYGIRNNKVIKIKKDIDQESESTQTRKIQESLHHIFIRFISDPNPNDFSDSNPTKT